jgi:hypothetical protein
MEIKLKGEMTLADIRKALFEQLCTLEDDYAVHYSRGATLYLNPTDGLGDDVTPACRAAANSGSSTAPGRTNALLTNENCDPVRRRRTRRRRR